MENTRQGTYWIVSIIAAIVGTIVFLIVAFWPDRARANSYWQDDKPANEQTTKLSDHEIVQAIEKKTTYDGIEVKDLKVYATEGIVTIDGTVESLGDRNHINKLSGGVRDVRGIVNQLNIATSRLTDETLQKAVERRLRRTAATDSFQIAVAVDNGEVTLSGIVDSLAERMLANQVAADVRGVRSLVSNIEVEFSERRNDSEIRDELVARIKNHVWIDEQRLTVGVEDGVVTFEGTVADQRRKYQLSLIGLASGVKSINIDKIIVDPKLANVPKKTSTMRNDAAIRTALIDSIRLDPRVDARMIKLDLKKGIIVLRGTVNRVQAKRAAVETAYNVTGVSNVIDEIQVKPTEPRKDSTIKQELDEEIASTATLKYDGIRVSVDSGVVTLAGTVPSYYQSRRVESVAHGLRGVIEVNNEITIDNPRNARSDFDIGIDIERSMRWSPYLDITELKYTVTDGLVKFSGTVTDRPSLDLARAMAIDAGARDINAKEVAIE